MFGVNSATNISQKQYVHDKNFVVCIFYTNAICKKHPKTVEIIRVKYTFRNLFVQTILPSIHTATQ
jgi:hypothetical protein